MKPLAKLAWRNIWRNRRRTILTALAITFAIGLTVFTRGLQFGMYEQTINYNVALGVGHVQIHRDGYWEKKTLRNTLEESEVDTAWIASLPNVSVVSPKLVTEALIAVGDENSTGARIVGVIPSRENALSSVPEHMTDGRWLTDSDTDGIAIGRVLADNLEASIGDTVVYFTQGRYGATAAGLYVVRGIFKSGDHAVDAFTAYVPLKSFQRELFADGRLTQVAVTVDDHRAIGQVVDILRDRYGGADLEVMDYAQLIPDIMSSIAFDKASGAVFLILLIAIAGLGILETILMSVMERYHEFGVMMAIGMHRRNLVALILFEALFVAFVGSLAGNLLGYGLNMWLMHNPITLGGLGEMYQEYGFSPQLIALIDLHDQAFWTGSIFAMTLVVAMWPAWVAIRFSPVEAIRQS